MSVHYKFKSALEYDTITFDGLHISVSDLKNAILQQKRIGKSTDFDLQVTNAQTKEIYTDETALIPKNTSLLIARIPTVAQNKPKQWEGYGGDATPPQKSDDGGPIAKAADLSSLDAPEDDKIKAMMSQSTQDYDPSNYQKIRGANQVGAVPPSYRCYKCHQAGHWIKDCTYGQGSESAVEIKKSTGIPQSFMVPVEGPQVPGAMITPNGSYAVPVLDHQAYNHKPQPFTQLEEPKQPDIPEDLICSICSDLLTDAVMIPCCGNSFCDECIRFSLLESEDHECPDCHEKDNSPGTLIPNRFLRKSVANFKNTTGYIKKPIFRPPPKEHPTKEKEKTADKTLEEKTIISEADSTEQSKNKTSDKDSDVNESGKSASETEPVIEGPPGVSPIDSPTKMSKIKRVASNRSETSSRGRRRSRDVSPKPRNVARNSPTYNIDRNEDRPGTPTVDEPGMGPSYQYVNPPPPSNLSGVVPSMPPMQGPPPMAFPPGQQAPPFGGPPPNFRLPPPGTAPPYLPPGAYNAPRPMFDPRPNLNGPPPMYGGYAPGSRGSHRDYSDRRMRNRTPPGVIDDPLAAFNRMIREKDERERRAKQRMRRSSYSRSRSRSRSYSPLRSPRRMRSRSPRRRSRSRSFSISRRYKDQSDRVRDHDDYDRKDYRDHRNAGDYHGPSRDRHYRHDERHYYGEAFDDRGARKPPAYGIRAPVAPPPEAYYNPPPPEITQSQYQPAPNRYASRDYAPYELPSARKYEDIAPPGVEEPPVPGLETPKIETRYKEPTREEPKEKSDEKTSTKDEKRRNDKEKSKDHDAKKEKSKDSDKRRRNRRSRSRSPTPHKRSQTPEKKRKKREESSDRDKSDKEKRRDHSEDERKKPKDKKRRKDKERDKKEEKKKRKEKKEKHKKDDKEKKHKEDKSEKFDIAPKDDNKYEKEKSPTPPIIRDHKSPIQESKLELYPEDIPEPSVSEKTDKDYDKEYEEEQRHTPEPIRNPSPVIPIVEKELESDTKDLDESEERDILELHLNDSDLKAELEAKNEMLAPVPEKSKWEFDEDGFLLQTSPKDSKKELQLDKNGKVTKEVLKKAENAIFAKAINAIRPIEIKKISSERAKLYSGEKEQNDEIKTSPVRVSTTPEERKKIEPPTAPPQKLSIKERLGIKVNEPDKVIKIDDRLSPFSRRVGERNYGMGERRVEADSRKRDSRRDRDKDRRSRHRETSHKHREKKRSRSRGRTRDNERRKRSRTRSESDERKRKRRDKKRKEKDTSKDTKKREKDKEEKVKDTKEESKPAPEKRKPTIDESSFEPDYDLESETESKKADKESSSSDSSSSSSEDDRKKKKHRKHKKKKYRKDSSSSSSESDSDSSDSDRDKKKKKHKKKKKKSKHK